jgi:transcriptional regulator GlxA family with amidase domain
MTRRAHAGHVVVIVAFDGFQSLDLSGPAEVLTLAGWPVRIVTTDGAPVRSSSGITIVPDGDLALLRVVEQGKIITAAGVSAGIDMGLRLAAKIAGDDVAMAIQLGIEYDPQPPFDAGSPEKAPAHIVNLLKDMSRFAVPAP